jgi:hypothetical protein
MTDGAIPPAATVPLLDDNAAGWLRWALRRVHPGHPWIDVVGRTAQRGSGMAQGGSGT